jgi:hypothetical protein
MYNYVRAEAMRVIARDLADQAADLGIPEREMRLRMLSETIGVGISETSGREQLRELGRQTSASGIQII